MYILTNNYIMNKIIEKNEEDTQEIFLKHKNISGAHQKFIDNKFLGCNNSQGSNNTLTSNSDSQENLFYKFSWEPLKIVHQF